MQKELQTIAVEYNELNARYEALRRERAALDEKAALFRGVDAQRHALPTRPHGVPALAEGAVHRPTD